jgi:hypothetical protein
MNRKTRQSVKNLNKSLALYDFDNTGECVKLNFSAKTNEKTPDLTAKVSKMPKSSQTKSKLKTPAFEFFSSKTGRNIKSDSGIFMTPSPVLKDTSLNQTNSKNEYVKPTVEATRKSVQQTPNSHEAKQQKTCLNSQQSKSKKEDTNLSETNNMNPQKRKRNKIDSSKEIQKNAAVATRASRRAADKLQRNRVNLRQRKSVDGGQRTINDCFKKSRKFAGPTSTPDTFVNPKKMMLAAAKNTDFSSPLISPVQKFTSSEGCIHGEVVASPADFGSSPTLRRSSRQSIKNTQASPTMTVNEKQVDPQSVVDKLKGSVSKNTVNQEPLEEKSHKNIMDASEKIISGKKLKTKSIKTFAKKNSNSNKENHNNHAKTEEEEEKRFSLELFEDYSPVKKFKSPKKKSPKQVVDTLQKDLNCSITEISK